MGNAQSQSELVLEERARTPTSFQKLFEAPAVRNDPLFSTVLTKNLAALQNALRMQGSAATLRKERSQGFSLLHLCAIGQWQEGLEAGLEAGAPVDAPSSSGYTPLHVACFFGLVGCCRLLLEHGANADLRSRRGSAAIHFAAQQSEKGVLELLIGDGINPSQAVDSPGFRSRTPLHLAVLSHGDPGIVNLLIDAGAKVSEPNRAMNGTTPLHTAAHHGRVDAMRALLEANADPNLRSDDDIPPLLEIFAHPGMRHSEAALRQMFVLLRDAGANVNAILPRQGYSLLHFAMTVCTEESTVRLILDSGVNPAINVNRVLSLFDPRSKSSMLHKAAKRGWVNVARQLIAAGADLMLRDRDALQPLHLAIIGKRDKVVTLLLDKGADPYALAPNCYPSFAHWKMQRGMQAIQAMMEMQPAVLEALQQMLTAPELELSAVDLACCVPQWIPTVEAFLAHGVVPSEEALHLAVQDTPIMRMVVERPMWTPERHKLWPEGFRCAVRELLRCVHRASAQTGLHLPHLVVSSIVHKLAYPISEWADPEWLVAQRERAAEPPPGLLPPGLEPELPAAEGGPQVAEVMQHVLQQLQQGIAQALGEGPLGAGVEDDEEVEDEGEDEDDLPGLEDLPGLGPAAAAGPALGGLPPMGLPPGMPPGLGQFFEGLLNGGGGGPGGALPQPNAVHHQQLGNMQVIQMEFQLPFGAPPGGLGQIPAVMPAPLGFPGFVFHAGPMPLAGNMPFLPLPPFMNLPGGEDEALEEDEMGAEGLVGGANLPQQQQPQAGWAAVPAAPALAPDSPPPLIDCSSSEDEDEDLPGPSTRHAGRKRRGSDSNEGAGPSGGAWGSGGDCGGRYSLRPRTKRQRKD